MCSPKNRSEKCGCTKNVEAAYWYGLGDFKIAENSIDMQIRIAKIEAEFNAMIHDISANNVECFDEQRASEPMMERAILQQKLSQAAIEANQNGENEKTRLDEIYTILDVMKNHPLTYDDKIIRKILECVVVESRETVKVIFAGRLELEQALN